MGTTKKSHDVCSTVNLQYSNECVECEKRFRLFRLVIPGHVFPFLDESESDEVCRSVKCTIAQFTLQYHALLCYVFVRTCVTLTSTAGP